MTSQLNCRIRPIVIPEQGSHDRKEFCRWRAKMYVRRYSPDMDALSGLFIIFESYKLPEEQQIEELKRLREGHYVLNCGKWKKRTKNKKSK